ncbi:MAG: MBL fold metallo-hydrolase [bacterium]|nr:MBL fold metallo-hydrolase [bacterium]
MQLHVVSDGGFRLDGGAMFGVVPRVLWEQRSPPDELNRIRMTTNCLLVESPDGVVLVDTGIGDKNDAKFRDMFGMREADSRLPDAIRARGFALEDIRHVVLTHLHFDHCGWNTRFLDGEIVPTFPNAIYWVEAGELAHACNPTLRDRASYDERNWEILVDAGVMREFEGRAEPVPGLRAIKASGHNADMCVVLIESKGSTAVYWADLVPTTHHLPYPWIMGYDLYPLETLANKQLWLPRAHSEGWICFFEHDPDVACGKLVEEKPGRFVAEPVAV